MSETRSEIPPTDSVVERICPGCGGEISAENAFHTDPELFLCRRCKILADESECDVAKWLKEELRKNNENGENETLPAGMRRGTTLEHGVTKITWMRKGAFMPLLTGLIALSFLVVMIVAVMRSQWDALLYAAVWFIGVMVGIRVLAVVIRWLIRFQLAMRPGISAQGDRILRGRYRSGLLRWRRFQCGATSRIDLVWRACEPKSFSMQRGDGERAESWIRIRSGDEPEILFGVQLPADLQRYIAVRILRGIHELRAGPVVYGDDDPRVYCPDCGERIPISQMTPATATVWCGTCERTLPFILCMNELNPGSFRSCVQRYRTSGGVTVRFRIPTSQFFTWMISGGIGGTSLFAMFSTVSPLAKWYIPIFSLAMAILTMKTYDERFAWKYVEFSPPDDHGRIDSVCSFGLLFRRRYRFECNAATRVVHETYRNAYRLDQPTPKKTESMWLPAPVIETPDQPKFPLWFGNPPMPFGQQQYLASQLRKALAEVVPS